MAACLPELAPLQESVNMMAYLEIQEISCQDHQFQYQSSSSRACSSASPADTSLETCGKDNRHILAIPGSMSALDCETHLLLWRASTRPRVTKKHEMAPGLSRVFAVSQ